MKKAGASTRERAQERRWDRKSLGVTGMIVIVLALLVDLLGIFEFQGTAGAWIWDAGLSVLVLVGLSRFTNGRVERMEGLHSEELRANQGAAGEELVGSLLDALPKEEWRVLHDVKSKFGNIDHIVLHRRGHLFLIETKSHKQR
ncbi:nuclease-related domain-containing protein [Verrucomicrobium sp. GAS474]|uniref:nuclease-related domain-containing protein n=1 Tax=Verrucomicrobium sp. GAS474 TaxID=1882831 RepID=UPI0012FFCA2F|nr:nuclease-related domain-containing protein [Verrucomicrobium sp. GAS474]